MPANDNEYLVQLSENIPDLEYKLKDDFSKKRIMQSLQSIFSTFPESDAYSINTQSTFYHSLMFPFIERELSSRKYLSEKYFTIIPYQESEEVFNASVKRILFSKPLHKPVLLTVDYKNFHLLTPHVNRFLKKGGKLTGMRALLHTENVTP